MEFKLNKDFLNLDEVAIIFNQNGIENDIDNPKHKARLLTTIIGLMQENKVTPVFYYDGVIKDLQESESFFYRGFFIYDTVAIYHYIETNELNVKTEPPYNAYYRFSDKKPYRLLKDNETKLNLLFPKSDIEKLFYPVSYQQLQAENECLILENKTKDELIIKLQNQLPEQTLKSKQNNKNASKLNTEDDEYQHNQRKPIKHLLYALVKNKHLILTQGGQGTAHTTLFNMCIDFGVPVTEGFLKSRLMELYVLEQELQNNSNNKNK